MKRLSFPLKNISVVFLIATFFIQCASVHKSYYSELIPRYPGTASLSLSDSSCIEGLKSMLVTFGDTLNVDTLTSLWHEIKNQTSTTVSKSPKPSIEAITVMTSFLRNQGYTIATINPDSYESLFALSKLPLLMWTLIIHHQDSKPAFITKKDVALFNPSVLSDKAPDLQLHLTKNIIKSDDTYTITTLDGFTLSGLATDQCNAQILPGTRNTPAKYLQVVDCFIVSLLPPIEIQEHIDEWYSTTPYKYVKPAIKGLQ